MQSLKQMIVELAIHGVEFATVGGAAAVLHGVPMVTVDVDIIYPRNDANCQRLMTALQTMEAVFRNDPRNLRPSQSHLRSPGHKLLRTRYGQLDVLGSLGSAEHPASYEDLVGDIEQVEMDGHVINLLSLARVIAEKEQANRPKDLAVLSVLRATLAERSKGRP